MSSNQPPPPTGGQDPDATRIASQPLGERAQQYGQPQPGQQPAAPDQPPVGQPAQPGPPPTPPYGQQPPPPSQSSPPPPYGQPEPGQPPPFGQPQPAYGHPGAAPKGFGAGATAAPLTGLPLYLLAGLAGASLLAIVFVFLPWASAEIPGAGSTSANGVAEGASDGWICLVLALITIGLLVARYVTRKRVLGLAAGIAGVVSGLLIALISIANIAQFNSDMEDAEAMIGQSIDAGISIGLYLLILMAVAMIALGAVVIVKRKQA